MIDKREGYEFWKKKIYIRKKDEYFEILIEKFSNHIYDGKEYGITEYERIRYKKISLGNNIFV